MSGRFSPHRLLTLLPRMVVSGTPRRQLHPQKALLLLRIKPFTLLSYERLSALYDAAHHLVRSAVEGSFVECGVWNGGSAAVLAHSARSDGRHVWLFDSWEGLPEPTERDVSLSGKRGERGMDLGSQEVVEDLLFTRLRLPPRRVHLVRGWFQDTLPAWRASDERIALLHLDCDWYESVKLSLDELYDSVVPGGYVFIDDYGHWRGCKEAVDEFISRRGLTLDLKKIDYTGVYFRK